MLECVISEGFNWTIVITLQVSVPVWVEVNQLGQFGLAKEWVALSIIILVILAIAFEVCIHPEGGAKHPLGTTSL